MKLKPYQEVRSVLPAEATHEIALVLRNARYEVGSDADVESAIARAGKDVCARKFSWSNHAGAGSRLSPG